MCPQYQELVSCQGPHWVSGLQLRSWCPAWGLQVPPAGSQGSAMIMWTLGLLETSTDLDTLPLDT